MQVFEDRRSRAKRITLSEDRAGPAEEEEFDRVDGPEDEVDFVDQVDEKEEFRP